MSLNILYRDFKDIFSKPGGVSPSGTTKSRFKLLNDGGGGGSTKVLNDGDSCDGGRGGGS